MDLKNVLTIHELADKLGTTTANIRMQIKNKTIPEKFFRKTSSGAYLFKKEYIKFHKENKKKAS